MTRKEELGKILDKTRKELDEILDKEEYEKNIGLVGKYYKYRNSYSCPKEESDYWYIYRKITGIDEKNRLKVSSFSMDKDGKIEINNNDAFFSSGWIEISKFEFDLAWDAILLRIKPIIF